MKRLCGFGTEVRDINADEELIHMALATALDLAPKIAITSRTKAGAVDDIVTVNVKMVNIRIATDPTVCHHFFNDRCRKSIDVHRTLIAESRHLLGMTCKAVFIGAIKVTNTAL